MFKLLCEPMNIRFRAWRMFGLLALLMGGLSATPAVAQHGGDILLQVVNDKIVTGLINDEVDPPVIAFGQRVFESELGDIAPRFSDEPGFDSPAGTFSFPSNIRFSILDSLRIWNGVNFDTIPTERMSVEFGPLGPIRTPDSPAIVDGFDLAVAADGSWHRHLEYTLDAPGTTGIYLLQLQLSSSDPLIRASEPFYLVFNQNDLEVNHAAAVAFVESEIVPEPATAWLAGIGLVGLLIVSWRRRPRHPRR